MKPTVVISGVNLVDFGPLAVFRDALQVLQTLFAESHQIVALVHRQELLAVEGITYIQYPQIKGSWLRRLRFEYFDCMKLSKTLKPALWIAMHDITPRVQCSRQVVYCHNPAPFYRFSFREAFLDPKFGLFTLFYRVLYGIGIGRNEAVIVQQEWVRREFKRRYRCRKIIVANASAEPAALAVLPQPTIADGMYRFVYPAFARTFKNHAMLLEAVSLLEQQGVDGFELMLTVDARSNRLGERLFEQYKHLRTVRWLGSISRERVYQLYSTADCLVFPSKLETWGLPITEFKATGKPILAADLPYAHETVGNYEPVTFFSSDSAQKLSMLMMAAVQRSISWGSSASAPIPEPFAADWKALWNMLLPSIAANEHAKEQGN